MVLNSAIQVDVRGFAEQAGASAAALAKAEALVPTDDEVMNGEPVFAGTRVPVRTIAAWIASGDTEDVIRNSFPTVTDAMIEAAPLWAKTHPQRGRPKSFADLNPEWNLVSSKRVKLGGR